MFLKAGQVYFLTRLNDITCGTKNCWITLAENTWIHNSKTQLCDQLWVNIVVLVRLCQCTGNGRQMWSYGETWSVRHWQEFVGQMQTVMYQMCANSVQRHRYVVIYCLQYRCSEVICVNMPVNWIVQKVEDFRLYFVLSLRHQPDEPISFSGIHRTYTVLRAILWCCYDKSNTSDWWLIDTLILKK